MGKLNVINPEQFILEGEFEKIEIPGNIPLDENSVLKSLETYKTEVVDKGLAVGELSDGFLLMPTVDGDQLDETPKEPAFMVLDVWWIRERKSIGGQVIILETGDGMKIRKAIQQGTDCYVSSSGTESYAGKTEGIAQLSLKVTEIKDYKISLMNFQNTI